MKPLLTVIPATSDMGNASYILLKKKLLSFWLTWCQLLGQLLGYAIFEGKLLPYVPLKK